MKDPIGKSQNIEKVHDIFPEDAEEISRASSILLSMNERKEKPEAIDQLVKVMQQVENQNKNDNDHDDDHRDGSGETSSPARIDFGTVAVAVAAADYDRLPKIGRNIEGIELPKFPPQEILREIIGECCKPFAKQLTVTDTNRSQSRLSFSKEYVHSAIFHILNSPNELEAGIEVSVYDPRGEEYTMTFKAWARHKAYVLSGNSWLQLATDNNFTALSNWLNIWAFRNKINGRLCFAIDVQSFDTPQLIKKRN